MGGGNVECHKSLVRMTIPALEAEALRIKREQHKTMPETKREMLQRRYKLVVGLIKHLRRAEAEKNANN